MGAWDELDTNVNLTVDTSQLDALIDLLGDNPVFKPAVDIAEKFKKGIQEGSKEGASKIANRIKSLQELMIAGNGSIFNGDLLKSIEIEQEGDYSYVVGTNIEHFYPLCVEKGRGEVKPINAPFLQWQNLDGSWVRTHYSRPAKPRPFVKPTYETIKSEAIDIVKEAIYDATIG